MIGTARAIGRPMWSNPWFGRRDLIPPDQDTRTLMIDRAMVTHGLLTPEELVQYKFDMKYSKDSIVAQFVDMLSNAKMPTPETAQAQELIRNWDMTTNPENPGTAIMVYTLNALNKEYPGSIKLSKLGQGNVNESMLMDAFGEAAKYLDEHHLPSAYSCAILRHFSASAMRPSSVFLSP